MEDSEEFEAQDLGSSRPGHTIGQPSIMTGMSRNLMHSNSVAHTSVAPNSAAPNSIASQPNIPVRTLPNPFPALIIRYERCIWWSLHWSKHSEVGWQQCTIYLGALLH